MKLSLNGVPVLQLREVVSVVSGGTPRTNISEYWGGDVQWLTPKDMGHLIGATVASTSRTLTEEGLKKSSAKLVPVNSVILSTRAPIGHLAINAVPMAFNQGCRGLVVGDRLDHRYLYYYLETNRSLLERLGDGTTFKELSATKLMSVTIPIPSILVQRKVVAKIDDACKMLEGVRANTECILGEVVRLRQFAFDIVCDGRINKDR